MNQYQEYAKRYNCSIASAICDRDWPLTESECIQEFKDATGRAPSDAEIAEMHPNTARQVQEFNEEELRGTQW